MKNVEDIYPLTPLQGGMLFHSLMAPESGVYVNQVTCTLPADLDVRLFRQAWERLVQRHGALRTAFLWDGLDEPLQVVRKTVSIPWQELDWRGLPAAERQRRVEELRHRDRHAPLPLSKAPLMRFSLVRLDGELAFLWTSHHLLLDGWSLPLLVRELVSVYGALRAGREPDLPPARPFGDYVAWLQRQDTSRAEPFWRGELAGLTAPNPLGIAPPAEAARAAGHGEHGIRLSREVTAELQALAARHKVTLQTLTLGAWAVLVSRYSGEADVVFGNVVSGRPAALPGVEAMVGMFVNTLPVRVRVDGAESLAAWLRRLQERQLARQELEHTPLAEIQRWSEVPAGSPLFETLYVFENYPNAADGGPSGLRIGDLRNYESTNYPLTLTLTAADQVALHLMYERARVDDDAATRLLGHLATLLAGMAEGLERHAGELGLLNRAEALQLARWNDTARDFPQACIHELFAGQAERSPDAVAVACGGRELTYGEIGRRARRLAHRLRRAGVGPGSPVGLGAESLPEMVVGMLGILAAGGAYVPLDLAYPQERLAFMLEDAGAAVLVAEEGLAGRLPTRAGLRVELLDRAAAGGEEDGPPLASLSSPGDPAYVIYTSGSTGRPKGVVVPHRAVVRLVRETDYVQLGPDDRVAQAANSSFDAATFEVWGALLNGGRLVGIERETLLSPGSLSAALRRDGVSVLFLTTALFNQVAREVPAGLASLRVLLFGGERVDPAAVRAVLRDGPPAHLLHVYGPTETTTFATWQRVETVPPAATVPIGRPLANGILYVLAPGLNLQPVEVPGELYLGGDGLAHGYHARPELTAERFVPDPFGSPSGSIPGERLYRTGDLVRQRPDGAVEFLGRLDGQVKIRGFRIEPGEVEAALLELPGVREAAVLAREDGSGARRLVAYVAGEVTAEDLRAALRERLPDYMVPAVFVTLETLPLTPNGKVDRQALPAPEAQSAPEAYLAPRTPVEEVVAGIWAELLGRERVGLDGHFFALGGHSLLAARVISRLRRAFGVELPVRDLFEAPTVAALAARVEAARRTGSEPALPPLLPAPRQGDLPLSFAQARLWFIDQLEPGTPLYNLPLALRVDGPLAPAVLERSLREIVRRHEALRTVFALRGDSAVQVIVPPAPFVLPLVDLSGLPAPAREATALALAVEEAGRPFDLARDPLLRGVLLRLAVQDHAVALTLHHVASDGWSLGILVGEVTALYAAFASGQPSPLPELPVQYADFAVWQRSWLRGEVLEGEIAWWRRQLAGLPPLLELPTDRPRPAVQSYRGATRPVRLPAEIARPAEALGRREGATLFMVLLAAFQSLLARASGQDDLAVGSPTAGRTHREIEELIGFFVNTLVLRADLAGAPTFGELLGRVRETALAAWLHQDVPFEKLVEELTSERSLAHAPLFQAMLVLQNAPAGSLEIAELRLRPMGDTGTMAKFDLTLNLAEHDGGLLGTVEYATDLFDAATIDRLIQQYARLLAAALAAPERPAAELPLLSPAERHQAIAEWNDTVGVAPPAGEGLIHDLLAARAEMAPELPAVVQGEERLTHGELAERSGRLAAHLRALGVGPDVLVALFLERSVDLVVALLAVLKAGGAYLPLETSLPRPRLSFLLEDSRVTLVLTRTGLLPALPEHSRVVCLDDLPARAGDVGPAVQPAADNLAYVLYTSGSTGAPKGVAVTHRGLANYVLWAAEAYPAGEGRGAPVHSPLSFDLTVTSLFPPLLAGRCVELVPAAEGVEGLAAALAAGGFGLVKLTPAHLDVLQRLLPPERVAGCADAFVIGGEPLAGEQLAFWRLHAPGLRLINEYGPTETVVGCCTYEVPVSPLPAGPVSIGRPIANTRILLLDERLGPVPIGVTGELCIGGAGVCRGYLHRPGLTAEKLVPDPFGTWGERLYRTGDLARRLPDGTIEFLGRSDHQVKIRGFRIELGEIEAALVSLAGVREAVVLARSDGSERSDRSVGLIAYVVGDISAIAAGALREALRERLPDYMVPAAFVKLEALPLTPNGKVDRKALPAPERQSTLETYLAPRTPVEEVLAGIWAEVLGLERVGANDQFFALGGHSLLATQVMSRLRAACGVEMPLRDLFEAPTVAGLAARVEAARRTGAVSAAPPLRPVPREGTLPLSFAQQRLWLIDQLEPGSPLYNMPVALRVQGPLDVAVLALCLGEIVRRHEALRTVFAAPEGQPVQVIQPPAPFVLPLVDLSGLPQPARETAALALAGDEAGRPFDLARGPLLRGALLRLAEGEHVAALTMHHIASDGWSLGLLVREVAALYAAIVDGRPSPLPELPVQYADFALWQRGWLRGEVLEAEIDWWRQQLAGLPPLLELPADRPRPAVQSHRGATRPVRLPAGLVRAAEALGRREGATLFMVLLTAFQALLARYSGQDDLAVGSPVAGRTHREIEELIGFFVNTLVLRGDLAGTPTFRELLCRVRETALAAWLHQDVPFERLVEELTPERSLAHAPLFQVMLVLQNAPVASLEIESLRLRPVNVEGTTARFDLTLSLEEHDGGLLGTVEHATDLYDAATVDRLMAGFERLLAGLVEGSSERRVGEVGLLSAAEALQLRAWNETATAYPLDRPLHAWIEDQARRSPAAVAIVFETACETEELTYGELDRRANRLARRLQARGCGPESRVGVLLERSCELLVALLGILKAGSAYVPLDPEHPADRLAFQDRDARLRLIVTRAGLAGRLPGDRSGEGERCLFLEHGEPADGADGPLAVPVDPDHPAYVLYTSGSTGRPKGAVISHRAIVNRLLWMQEALQLSAADRVLQKTPFSFDVSVWELFWPLMTGARLVVAVPGGHRDNAYLARLIQEQGITVLHFVPSMLQLFLEEPGVAECRTLRDVVCSGEALPAALARRFAARLGDTRLHNLYGPTEAAVDVTSWVCEAADVENDRGGIPIGRPIANTRIHLLDRHLLPVPVGVPGELFIAGVNLARGYVERPDLTAERFLPDPEGGEPGGRVYRTGDLARWRTEGAIEYLGRLDHQVKIRGVRIELGEVEAALLALPGVREAVVVAREERSEKRLVAYVVGDAPVGALRSGLRERLPEAMMPAAFVTLAALPLNANGKVDRKALPAPEQPGAAGGYVAPRTREEEILAAVWAQALRLPRVGVNDNFFELGGDSILSVQIVARARQAGLLFTMRQVFEHQTVAGLARHAKVTAAAGVRAEQGPVAGEVPLTPIQRWFFAQGFAEPHHFNQALLLEPTEPLIPATLEKAMAAVVEHHDALRLRFALQADGWHQENARTEPVAPFHQVDLSGLPTPRVSEACEQAATALQAGFDLTAGPLTRLCLFHAEARTARLLWVAHHLVVDGVSWRVLVEDLEKAYRQAGLPPKTTSFQEWARRTTGYAAQAGPEERETARVPVPRLPVDFPAARDLVGDEATVSFELSAEETSDLLQTLPSVFQSRIDEALLSALVRALAGWTGSPRLRVDLEGHGREPLFEDLDVSRTVGWFTSLYPVVLEAGDAGPGEALGSARERLRAKGLPGLDAAPKAEILFNYLGQVDATSGESSLFQSSTASPGPSRSPRAQRSHPLEIVGLVAEGRLRITLTYGSRTYAQETAERLAADYAGALRQLLRHGRESEQVFTPSDTWSPLVPIQPLGARAPLFCVHALGGEVLGYYQLARQLGADQPVYGLQARPLDGKAGQAEAPQVTIEEMAAEYLDAVRSLQPAGPYLLAGYSFGGVVAFEMARQLNRAGEEVALLAILDQPVSPGDEAAAVDPAAVIAEMLRHQARGEGRTLELDEEALRGLPLDDQLARGLEVLGGLEALGPGFDVPLLRDLALGWSSRATAFERYRVATYPGRITLLRASRVDPAALQELSPRRRQVFEDSTLGWGAVAAGGVEVHTVPGNHQTIVEAPHVATVAGILGACIARAVRGPGRTPDRAGGQELDAAIAALRT